MSVLGAHGLRLNVVQARRAAPPAGPRVSVASGHCEAGVGTSAYFALRHIGALRAAHVPLASFAGAKPARRESGGCLTVYCMAELAAAAVYAF